jgi:hypothetical protein
MIPHDPAFGIGVSPFSKRISNATGFLFDQLITKSKTVLISSSVQSSFKSYLLFYLSCTRKKFFTFENWPTQGLPVHISDLRVLFFKVYLSF